LIFVTVGNAHQGFRRLLVAMDEFAGSGLLGERVLMQIGHEAGFVPRASDWRRFMRAEEFAESLRDADVVVTHGGCGTLREVIRIGKTPVVMPRRKYHGEHVDDHQVELVEAYAERDLVVPAYEKEDLPGAIERARSRKPERLVLADSPMIGLVAQAVDELLAARASRRESRRRTS
jgi:UDP-N-acetylglucosamine transferase subunit ALG13